MSIDDLTRIVKPPNKPRHGKVHSDTHQSWSACQQSLGIALPGDWKLLGETYGSGTFRDVALAQNYLWIYNPLSPAFERHIRSVCDLQRENEQFHGQEFELHPFFPDRNGFFPIGETDSYTIWFRTDTSSNLWPIVVWAGYGTSPVGEFQFPLIEFLVRLFKGEISIWEDNVVGFPDGVRFESDRKL